MKTSLSWLSHYVDIPWDARGLAEALTLAGLEVEGIEETTAIPDGVVVAEILSREPHPDADKLSICMVTTGTGDPLQIVCGAPNCDLGNRVPLATIGTDLGGFKIKKAKLRGVESFGMLCSEDELGLGDDHSGLLLLASDATLGTPLRELYRPDTVIDWEVTPNRPDWLSHIGIAREIAAVRGKVSSFHLPEVTLKPVAAARTAQVATVTVDAPDLCPRYIARVIRNVRVGPSPEWMQKALLSVGVRPISNIVDITNFVLMECGQPLHAFDYDLLAGHTIVVRRARDGEVMVTLDDREHELSADNLVIADAEGAVALAGIMGGANSEISPTTTTVLLESAVFNPVSIRATAKRLGISSESSHRFERGVGLDMAEFASARAASLMCDYAGGELLEGKIDVYASPYQAHAVSCRVQRASALIGVPVTASQIASCCERLQLPVTENTGAKVTIAVPSFRLDLDREVDIIEEVARLHGLQNLPEKVVSAQTGGSIRQDAYVALQGVRSELLGLGLTECMNYSTIGAEDAMRGTGVAADELVTLANPISAEGACMRPSLLPGMLRSLAHNIAHHNSDLALFEMGRVIAHVPNVPEERQQVVILLTGARHPERFGSERDEICDFYDLKGLLEGWFASRRVADLACRVAPHPAFRSGVTAEFCSGGTRLAVFGELTADLTAGMRLTCPVFLALVEMDNLVAMSAPTVTYQSLPQFPSTARDISLVAPRHVTNGVLIDALSGSGQKWLERVDLCDVYEDEKVLGPDRRGLTYSLTYRDLKRTLTDAEVNAAHEKVKARLAATLPVEFR